MPAAPPIQAPQALRLRHEGVEAESISAQHRHCAFEAKPIKRPLHNLRAWGFMTPVGSGMRMQFCPIPAVDVGEETEWEIMGRLLLPLATPPTPLCGGVSPGV